MSQCRIDRIIVMLEIVLLVNLTADVVDDTLSLMLRHTMLPVVTPLQGEKALRLRPRRSIEDIMVGDVWGVDLFVRQIRLCPPKV